MYPNFVFYSVVKDILYNAVNRAKIIMTLTIIYIHSYLGLVDRMERILVGSSRFFVVINMESVIANTNYCIKKENKQF